MARDPAAATEPSSVEAGRSRLARDDRREALLDAAARLVETGSIDDVTIESVAAAAGVSRPLIYKHFANRDELLGALYRREAADLHRLLTERVGRARNLEEMFDHLVSGSLEAAAERGPIFTALRSGGWTRGVRREQRDRDVQTARAFGRMARREGLDPRSASPAAAMLLSMIDSVLTQWRLRPEPAQAELLRTTYMTIVRATLAALRTHDQAD